MSILFSKVVISNGERETELLVSGFPKTKYDLAGWLLFHMALKANRYSVKNANDPTPGNFTEEKQSELDDFAYYVELILGVLGYKVFSTTTSSITPQKQLKQKKQKKKGLNKQ